MSDNIFDRLFELFQSPGPVNWKLAREIMRSVAGDQQPVEPALAEEYQELALAAELRLGDLPGLATPASTELQPVDGPTWAEENQQGLAYLVEPLAAKLSAPGLGPAGAIFQTMTPALLGMQAGTMIGFLSQRVLGQFDTGFPMLGGRGRYLVVPNVEAFTTSHGLDPHQVRLWAAMQEISHDMVMDVPWLRGHVEAVAADMVGAMDLDGGTLAAKLENLSSNPEQLQGIMEDATSLASLLGIDLDPAATGPFLAVAAFVEGFGDYAVATRSGPLLTQLDEITAAAAARRVEPNEAAEAFEQLTGVTLDRSRAADAAGFCRAVADRWGEDALARTWEAPEHLPRLDELTDPLGWAARVLLPLGDLGIGDEPESQDPDSDNG